MKEIVLNFVTSISGVLSIVVVITAATAYIMGVTLFRQCPKCSSRWTQSNKGWLLTPEDNDHNGWKFAVDIECSCCKERTRIIVPEKNWPKRRRVPFVL